MIPESWPDHAVYGWRARLGLIVPPTNTANEAEWHRVLPDGITLHSARMPLHHADGPVDDTHPLAQELARAARDLAGAGVGVVAYGCTAGSMVEPIDHLCQMIEKFAGVPAVTTVKSVADALRALGARRVALATPYHDGLLQHEIDFFRRIGFEIVAARGLGIGAGGPQEYRRLRTVSPALVAALVRGLAAAGADAIFISCTDVATLPILADLEADLGAPIISSNQATLWAALRAARVRSRISGWGRLLQEI